MIDSRDEKEIISELSSRGGLKGYVKFLDKSREAIVSDVIFKSSNDNISVECAIQWNKSYYENFLVLLIIFHKETGVHTLQDLGLL